MSNMITYMDELLKTPERTMTYCNGLIESGSAGKRLYGSFSRKPGLCGMFHFIHYTDIKDPLTYKITQAANAVCLRTETVFMPSHIIMHHIYPGFEIEEKKFITWHDMAVDTVQITCRSSKIKFRLSLVSEALDGQLNGSFKTSCYSIAMKGLCSDDLLLAGKEISLSQSETFEFSIACVFTLPGAQPYGQIPSLEDHIAEFGSFFEQIPRLYCSDKKIEKVYYYRWYLLRHHLSDPNFGKLRHPIFYEGRYGYFNEADSSSKVDEWEFSRGVLASATHHLLDLQWHGDLSLAKGVILNYTENFGEMQPFMGYTYSLPLLPGCIRTNDCKGHYFFHLLPLTTWLIYQVDGDRDFLEKVEPSLRADLESWGKFDNHDINLPLMNYEGDSAMEFGPASHCVSKWDKDGDGCADLTIGEPINYESGGLKWGFPFPTRRTEVATFYAMNYFAFSHIYAALGKNREASDCRSRYKEVQNAISQHMWAEKSAFFHELRADGSRIMPVKQIGGIFPLFVLDPANPEGFLENLTEENCFNLEYGIPSVSCDSFGYFPNNSVNGVISHTCMWNGPVWPYAESLVLLAVGGYLKRVENSSLKNAYASYFKSAFQKYVDLHFLTGKGETPCIVEHYNPETGAPLSGQDDYNHSSFIDLFIRMVCGFDPIGEKICFSPVDVGLAHIKLENICYRHDTYSVEIEGAHAILFKNGSILEELD